MGLKRLIVKDFLSARRTYLNCSRINQQQQYQKPETSRYVAPSQGLVLALNSRGISMVTVYNQLESLMIILTD